MIGFLRKLFDKRPPPPRPQAEGWQLIDPRPRIAKNPYTFFVPSDAEKAAIEPGDTVKMLFEALGQTSNSTEEGIWVTFEGRDADGYFGKLDNTPLDIPGLNRHDLVRFADYHIISVLEPKFPSTDDDEQEARAFSRCHVDPAIIDDGARIGAIERLAPDPGEGARFPDTGWRIFAEGAPRPDVDDMLYLAIGVVLNKDDSILPYLDAPVGNSLRRNAAGSFAAN